MKSLVFDAHCICHKEKHAKKDLAFEGVGTGVIFGFMLEILKLAKRFDTNQLYFAWDSQSSKRKEVYSGYKSNRNGESTPEQIELDRITRPQFYVMRDLVLPELGFGDSSYYEEGYEADDLIASLTKCNTDREWIIASSDEDLYQLLTPLVSMYKPHSKIHYTLEDYIWEKKIAPDQWAMVKALAGCSSDCIPGIPRVGEKTAIDFIKGQVKPASKIYTALQRAITDSSFIDRNIRLVKLPFPETPVIYVKGTIEPSIDGYIRTCQRFGLSSIMDNDSIKKWNEFVVRR
jgi:DNA polymerase-1